MTYSMKDLLILLIREHIHDDYIPKNMNNIFQR